ncbi:hypothetical protein MLD38_034385 [Melastoma candidum]|uniref:Uncharacterized protein n=1 Tax=Melastoma candidum TaxID=119954 RepID=A0ACB9M9D7_9MYRT|nr:hypothetical protein MLD38_034385 [Melastoma candidum]
MRRSQQSKRVTWATDVSLCQVRLFLSEEAPAQVGVGNQDHLQAKTSWLLHAAGSGHEDILPPGFEESHSPAGFHVNVSDIPVSKWRRPPRFMLNRVWQVVSGEEGKEVENQTQREMRVLEAVYPRPSAIPQNPVAPLSSEEFHQSELQIPIVPITPIEDEEAPTEVLPNYMGAPITSRPPSASGIAGPSILGVGNHTSNGQILGGLGPDFATIASAASTAIRNSNDHGIDPELLVQILSDPKMVEELSKAYGIAIDLKNPVAATSSAQFHSHMPMTPSNHNPLVPSIHSPQPAVRPPARDVNYYKSLIQRHGEERQDGAIVIPEHSNNYGGGGQQPGVATETRPREPKGKHMRPCMYFNTPRGCRNGANCAYQHDTSLPPPRNGGNIGNSQNGKRMKLDREITGR